MQDAFPPPSLRGYRVHLVGIKGTGMTALAEILSSRGADLSGSDRPEKFYTDAILAALGVPVRESFDPANLRPGTRLVVHSAAYSRGENPELAAAARAGIPLLSYPEALGRLSARADSSGISGTHGKTTTTALAGAALRALGLPATVLAGSEVADFGGRSTLVLGERYLVAETCEYRRHFLNFRPRRVVVTNVEADHLDYFRDEADVRAAFVEYAASLPPDGVLIHNADDPGAAAVAAEALRLRPGLRLVPFGESARGDFRLEGVETAAGQTRFRLAGFPGPFVLPLPGRHSAWNGAAAVALALELYRTEGGGEGRAGEEALTALREALAGFRGLRRRSEVVGEARGVLFVDDYGHHPTEVKRTLEGLRAFYPARRLVVDFMSHTYSRTRALLDGFAAAFQAADEVILHDIYASAREERDAGVSGEILFREVSRRHPAVRYFADPLEALPWLGEHLREGDLFVTMGAGNNWRVGRELFERFSGGSA